MNLKHLLAYLNETTTPVTSVELGAYDDVEAIEALDISTIAYDSRKVIAGSLFVCMKGYRVDGHDFISKAIEQGALAIIVEDLQPTLSVPQIQVKESRKALAALGHGYYGEPSKQLKMIGVTATNGKTTTTFMIDSILKQQGLKTGLIGTVKVAYGDFSEAAYLTTPESLDLHGHLANMVKANVSHVSMEVSSSALELSRVGSVDFDIVALNNISREHIDLHGSFERYYDCKASLIREAKADQWAVLNLDDPFSACLANETKASVVTYGLTHDEGHLHCRDLDLSTGRATFTVVINKPIQVGHTLYETGSFPVRLSTPGYHSVHNAMSAIAIALLCEVPVSAIQKGLIHFSGVERRFELIFEDDFKIVDDHFANAGNIDVTLTTLTKMAYKNLIPVYAIRGSRGAAVIREAAQTLVKWAPQLGITSVIASLSKSHVTWKDEVTDEEIEIFTGVLKAAGIEVVLYDELPDAIAAGLSLTHPDDVLLLAGCQGMDYGAKIALEQIHNLRPELDPNQLFKALESRVAGVE